MVKKILPGQTIGIVGGGTTSRMIALAAKKLGYFVGILTNESDSPAAQVADWYILGSFLNQKNLMSLAEKSDVLTYESEMIDIDLLLSLQPYIEIPQLSELSSIMEDRLIERFFLESLNVNVAPYATITNLEDIQQAVNGIGFPSILKPVRVERNEPENVVLYSEQDFDKAKEILQTGTCILETWIPFEKELAVTVAMGASEGNIVSFPVSHTVYKAGVLQATIVPAQIELEVKDAIEQVAKTIARSLQMVGVLTLEVFVTATGAVYVKKIILHPHESCDYSIDVCNISQYEALVRAVCGLPLPEIILWKPSVCYPIYGDFVKKTLADIEIHPEWLFHFYGEATKESEHKMGHITIIEEKKIVPTKNK